MTHVMEQMTLPGLDPLVSTSLNERGPLVMLGDAFTFIRNGKSIKQSGTDGIPITRIETISNGVVDFSKFGYAGIESLEGNEDYVMQFGDILMSHINSEKHLGKVAIFESNVTVIHGMNLLCLRTKPLTDSRYAFYFFNSKIFRNCVLGISNKSVNQASFSVTSLRKLHMPLPPLPEQQRIVARLDKAQQLIDKRKEQLALMDALVQSLFYEMFGDPVKNEKGWEVKNLSDVANFENGDSDLYPI